MLDFADGLNVVAGPSDTGKTYVAQCLSFLMGSGKTPKQIPEAAPYDRPESFSSRARRWDAHAGASGSTVRARSSTPSPTSRHGACRRDMTETAPTRCRPSCWRWRGSLVASSGRASTADPSARIQRCGAAVRGRRGDGNQRAITGAQRAEHRQDGRAPRVPAAAHRCRRLRGRRAEGLKSPVGAAPDELRSSKSWPLKCVPTSSG